MGYAQNEWNYTEGLKIHDLRWYLFLYKLTSAHDKKKVREKITFF